MTEEEAKTRTITLTDRAPVKIHEDDWPELAEAIDHDGQIASQANRHYTLKVRQHADGRAIVYGVYRSRWQNEAGARGGELLDPGDDIPAAIKRVAEYVGISERLADECIGELPAVEL